MISNQILQSTVDGLKSITRKEITVISRDGKLAATTESDANPVSLSFVENVINSPAENQLIQGNQYFKVLDNGIAEYILVVSGEDEDSFRVGKLAAFHILALSMAYKERFDRDNFLKNLLLDNLLLVDIYSRAKKLRIENGVRRVVYLVETSVDSDMSAVEILRGIFPDRQKDFITAVDETSIILVKELSERDDTDDIEQTALVIADTLSTEAMTDVTVAIGSPITDLKNVSSSFKEARLAQDVRKIFEMEKQVVNYERLGIGRLIYQLPSPLCRIFINEMLQGFSMEDIDEELFITVQKFFENDLNVSKTAHDLFIHRNTLVYRLDKIQKLTRLDLRKFTDAITFKITLMVTRYMQYREKQSF
ncbi:MAG: helix-turn-helix domain-containing protein [Defluviitaleaceae bacterium]|nr:helix-turn-helix domain-containing protein [Defluviitaleaceae bacterium]MCL2263538.1 helix-turn-helix domain-containing protein [Defluviitaleaceae bacterium]